MVSISLLLLCLFFVFFAGYQVKSEVLPAIANGTFAIDTETIVLNHVWKGNEIYVLIAAYALLAIVFAYGGIRLAKSLISR